MKCIYFLRFLMLLLFYLGKNGLIQGHKHLQLEFSESFIVLAVRFKPLLYFELSFMYGVRLGSNYFFLHVDPVVPVPSLPIEQSCHPRRKSIDHKCLFLTLSSVPLIYIVSLLPMSHSLNYCKLCSKFFNCECESSIFVLFQGCFGYSGSLQFPHEFQDQSSNFFKKTTWDFGRD